MRFLIAFLLVVLMFPAAVLAQEPTPAPGGGGITVEPDPLPYDFEVLPYTEGGSEFAAFNMFDNPAFVNLMGSVSITLFSLLDSQNTLAIVVIILLAMWVLAKIHKFTTTSTPEGGVDMSFIGDGDDADPTEYEQQRTYSSNPYKVYRQKFVRTK